MTAPSNANTSGLENFGWWVEHTVAEPMFIRPPAFCPASDNYTITPLVTAASAQARIAELEAENESHRSGGWILAETKRRQEAEALADRLAKALERIERDYDEYKADRTEYDIGFENGLAAAAYHATEALQQETQK